MPLDKVLQECGREPSYLFFPTTSIVTLLYILGNGDSTEIAVVGNEGVVGVSLFMGGISTTYRAVVQIPGSGYKLNAKSLNVEFQSGGAMTKLLLRYTQALMTQITQTAVCNRHHTIQQRLCRWILLCLDRLDENKLHMTQEQISNMLGVRREGITAAACRLQHEGIIEYSRGHITIVDRQRLELKSCECYQVVKSEYDRLQPIF